MIRISLAFVLACTILTGLQAQDRQGGPRREPEQRKAEILQKISQKLERLSSRADLTQENRILHERSVALLDRARQASAGSYFLQRLESALGHLLDASEKILEPTRERRSRDESPDNEKRRAARDLEQSYFRIQQGDYFASRAQDSGANDYVLMARRLYQEARAAYDKDDFVRARGMAGAAREVIAALESLAQAATPIPEPPKG